MKNHFYHKDYYGNRTTSLISTEEWVDENLFLIHESNSSKYAKNELAKQIDTRCHYNDIDFKIKTIFNDEVRIISVKKLNKITLLINGENIYPNFNKW